MTTAERDGTASATYVPGFAPCGGSVRYPQTDKPAIGLDEAITDAGLRFAEID